MRLFKTHIILLLSIVGFLASTIDSHNVLKESSFLLESEIEESFGEEVTSFSVFKELSIEKANDGGNAIFLAEPSFFSNICFDFTKIAKIKTQSRSSKIAYFILYCCLKVNC